MLSDLKIFSDPNRGIYRLIFLSLIILTIPFFVIDTILYANTAGFLAYRLLSILVLIFGIWSTYWQNFSHLKTSLIFLISPAIIGFFIVHALINPNAIDASVYLTDVSMSGYLFAALMVPFPSKNKYKGVLIGGVVAIFSILAFLSNEHQTFTYQDRVKSILESKKVSLVHAYDKMGLFVITATILGLSAVYWRQKK